MSAGWRRAAFPCWGDPEPGSGGGCPPPPVVILSALAVCNGLIDQLLQRLRLLLGGYRTDDRLADDVAVLVNNIGRGVGEQPGGEHSGVTIRIKPDVFVGHALFGQNFLRLRDRRFVAVQSKRVDPDYRAAFFGKLLVQRFKLGNSRVSTNAKRRI